MKSLQNLLSSSSVVFGVVVRVILGFYVMFSAGILAAFQSSKYPYEWGCDGDLTLFLEV